MSEQELNSYRCGMGEEPTDEMLAQIMKEVAIESRESSKIALESHFEQMRRNIAIKKAKWAEQINLLSNV